jgi:ubiquinone/menaquinone biosynthesis C-methylase UbiE
MDKDIQQVYNSIALDFDRTRYKIWPAVNSFLNMLNSDITLGDIGCGNGKNMMLGRTDIAYKGIDLSDEFVKICQQKGLDVIKGNILNIPYEDNYFDNTMSIAVIHHLQNRTERIKAITELVRVTKYSQYIMIYVWAFEQPEEAKNKFDTQDEMVPYKTINGDIHYRYYHLYKKDELEAEVKEIIESKKYNIEIHKSGYERGNWYVIIKKL